MGAILKITFLGPGEVDDNLTFKFYALFPDTVTEFFRGESFKTVRAYPGQCAIGNDAISQAENYVTAFSLDYLNDDFTISRDINVVTITCLNGSDIFEPEINVGATFATFEEVITDIDNMIHIINMTPKVYVEPGVLNRNYLVTEDNYFILTENNKKIRI